MNDDIPKTECPPPPRSEQLSEDFLKALTRTLNATAVLQQAQLEYEYALAAEEKIRKDMADQARKRGADTARPV